MSSLSALTANSKWVIHNKSYSYKFFYPKNFFKSQIHSSSKFHSKVKSVQKFKFQYYQQFSFKVWSKIYPSQNVGGIWFWFQDQISRLLNTRENFGGVPQKNPIFNYSIIFIGLISVASASFKRHEPSTGLENLDTDSVLFYTIKIGIGRDIDGLDTG